MEPSKYIHGYWPITQKWHVIQRGAVLSQTPGETFDTEESAKIRCDRLNRESALDELAAQAQELGMGY